MTDAPEGTPAPEQPAPEAPAAEAPTEPTGDKPDEGKGGKDAVLADLAKERDKRQALEQKYAEAQQTQQQQLDAIAKALGLKSEDEAPDPAKITAELEDSRKQAAENAAALARYRLAVEKQVPSHLVEFVTGSTAEEVESSIEKVLAAFGNSKPSGPRPDPGQGVQGAPASLDAQIAEAEKAGNTARGHPPQGAEVTPPELGQQPRMPGHQESKEPSWLQFPGRALPTTCLTTTVSCSPSPRPRRRSCPPSAA